MKPKLLYVGMKYDYGDKLRGISYEHRNFYASLRSYCKNRQWELIHFDFMEQGKRLGQDLMTQRLFEVTKSEDPLLLFAVLFDFQWDPRHEVFRQISSLGTKTIHWFCDDHWRFENYSSQVASNFDFICTTANSALSKYSQLGIGHRVIKTQWACNHELYLPLEIEKEIDVSFVGQPHGDRREILELIASRGLPVEKFGHGWEGRPRLPFHQMIRLFSRSRINLNLSNACNLAGQQIKGRNFELPGTRSFQLTSDAENLRDYYIDGKEVVIFQSVEELIDKAKYYLKHDAEREKIAVQGHNRTLQEHTWHHRYDHIFRSAGENTGHNNKGSSLPSKCPCVSVIIPCYKHAEYLQEAVDSVLAQTYSDWEIVIVDDGSPDSTAKAAHQLIAEHPDKRLSLIQKENGGLPSARNAGIQKAQGKYILPLDADDKLHPEFLQKAVALLEKYTQIGIAFTHIQHFGTQSDVYRCGPFSLKSMASDNRIPYCSLYRKEVFDSVGGYRISMDSYEDWDFWLGALEKGWKGRLVPEALFFYRKKESSMLTEANNRRVALVSAIVADHPAIFNPTLHQQAEGVPCIASLIPPHADPALVNAYQEFTPFPWGEELGARGQRHQSGTHVNLPVSPCLATRRSPRVNQLSQQRVLIACTHFWPSVGGLETIAENLGSRLTQIGYQVDVATSAMPERFTNQYQGMIILSLDPSQKPSSSLPKASDQLRSLVASRQYKVCILLADPLNWIFWSVENLSVPQETRLILQPIINADGFGRWSQNREFRSRLTTLLKNAHAVISLTRSGVETRYYAEDAISSIYLPNATDKRESSMDFRAQFEVPKDKPLWLHVANLWPVKNHQGILNTFRQMPGDWRLVLVGHPSGDTGYRERVQEAAERDRRVKLIPGLPPESVSAAMEAADALILASHGEVSPVVILEAMSHATSWLATPECGAVHDLAGGIIAPLDEFPLLLKSFVEDPNLKKRLGQAGQAHWKECYQWARVISGWHQLIGTGKVKTSFEMSPALSLEMHEIRKAFLLKLPSKPAAEPRVSVIIPTFNRPETLVVALKSILNQTCQDFEIIVVNDAGQDVEGLVREMDPKRRIQYLKHPFNRGLAATRNTGIRAAKGKYTAYLDDDDVYYPNHLETLVHHLETTGEQVAYTDAYRIHQVLQDGKYVTHKKEIPVSADFDYDQILVGNFIPVLCLMHQKNCTDQVGGFDETLTTHEDWDLWIRMSRQYQFAHIRKATCEFQWRTDGSTMSSGNRPDFLRTMQIIYDRHQTHASHNAKLIEAQKQNLACLKASLNEKTEDSHAGPVEVRTSDDSVDVVIPIYGQPELVRRSVESVLRTTAKAHLILVDDRSPGNAIQELFGEFQNNPRITLAQTPTNQGFVGSCALGARLGAAPFILFLNSDTEAVDAGWLETLIPSANDIAITGPKLIYPPDLGGSLAGTIQHAGVARNTKGEPYHPFLGFPASHPLASRAHEVNAVTGGCLLIRRKVWEALGGFDSAFGRGMYEDVDLCWRARQKGYRIWYEPSTCLYHQEHASSKEGQSLHHENLGRNLRLLLERWGRLPSDEHLFTVVPNPQPARTDASSDHTRAQPSDLYAASLIPSHPHPALVNAYQAFNPLPWGEGLGVKGQRHQSGNHANLLSSPCSAIKIAVLSLDQPMQTCARLRLLQALEHFPSLQVTWAVDFVNQSYAVREKVLREADLIVTQRMFPGPESKMLLDRIIEAGKPVIHEMDDLLTDIPPTNPHTHYGNLRRPFVLDHMSRCQAVTVSTEALKSAYLQVNPNVYVLPNLIDERLWKRTCQKQTGLVIIGYTGTATHLTDLGMIEEALIKISEKYGSQVGFQFMGCATDRISQLPNFGFRGFQDSYDSYARTLQATPIDIALAPLEENAFNRCKSNIKWLEYSACGIPGIYSDLTPYQTCVRQGVTGVLASSNHREWFDALEELISDPRKREWISLQARREVFSQFRLSAQADLFFRTYLEILGGKAKLSLRAVEQSGEPAFPQSEVAGVL